MLPFFKQTTNALLKQSHDETPDHETLVRYYYFVKNQKQQALAHGPLGGSDWITSFSAL